MFPRLDLLLLPALLFTLATHGRAQVTSTSSVDNAMATASVAVDLLQTSLDSTTWPANNNINNGTTGAFDEDSAANPATVTPEDTYDFYLDLTAEPFGYDISRINGYSGWSDQRAGQRYTVFFRFVGDSAFTQVGPTVDVAANGESLVTSLFDTSGALLGVGVDTIRFVVEANGAANVWREIDVLGTGSLPVIEQYSASPVTTSPGQAVTLSWDVGPSVTSVSLDQGIGDVTALTDAQGLGSITLSPGPNTTTTYTLSATIPGQVIDEALVVTVTDQPVISSVSADTPFATTPGNPIQLDWVVDNHTSLTLQGTNVFGQTGQQVSPTGQGRYELVAQNANGIAEREMIVFGLPGSGGVIISEFAANNSESLLDEDGDSSDWIELYNPTTTPVQLGGYSLTDDPLNPQQWIFPATTLLPGQRLMVFASGKTRAVSGSELHTNFGLSSGGEYLALFRPDGVTVATEFSPEYPEQEPDISYGYDPSALGFRYFLSPSPGLANVGSFEGFVQDTSFSADRGIFTNAFSLVITSKTAGVTIRYTLDGTEPDETTGLVYNGPLTINQTTVIRAAAFKDNFLPTNIDTQTYIFPNDVVNQPEMRSEITQDATYGPEVLRSISTWPTIALSFEGDDIDRNEMPISAEFINFEAEATQIDAGAARFGSFATDFAKRSFRLHFRSTYGASRLNYPLFNNRQYTIPPVETFDSLDIRAGNHDMVLRGAYLGNPFGDDSMIDMGHVSPHGRFVNIYFNGEYRGMYHLRERWDAAMLSDYLPGSEEEYDTINANNAGRQFQTGDLQDGDLNDWDELQNRLVNEPRFSEVRDLLDLNDYIDFMILFTYGTSESEFRAGGSVTNGVGFKFFLKDADGFLQPPNGSNLPSGGFYPATHNGPLDAMTLLRDEADPDFMTLLGDRIHRQLFNDGALTAAESCARYERRREEARIPYFSEVARWADHFGRTIRTPEEWEAYHDFFCATEFPALPQQRIDLYRDAGMYPGLVAPTFDQHGGSVGADGRFTLTVPNTVSQVYLLSGPADTDPDAYIHSLDPRLQGGAINANATLIDFGPAAGGSVDFVQTGHTWNYLDDGSDQGTAWQSATFNDATWNSGPSPLGYGETGLGTTVSFGPDPTNKYATTYFRTTFNVSNPADFDTLDMRFLRDDGIAVYVNGVEVARDNLAASAGSATFADGAIGNANETTYLQETLNANLLVAGQNTIAVEIHQAAGNSSDIRFDLQLTGNPPSADHSIDINLTEPGWVLARSFDPTTGEWSALNEAFYTLDTVPADASNLVISEILYNPADPSGGELAVATDNDEFEFIELMNVGNQSISLADVTLAGGISFIFGNLNELAPGECLIVVENQQAFDVRYGTSPSNITFATDELGFTEYSGKLSNGGEQIILTDATGNVIHDFTYDDSAPWPTAPDLGYSLVLRNPAQPVPDHSIATNWTSSANIGGSPGTCIPNTAPVVSPLGPMKVDELVLLSFSISATDADLPAQTLTFSLAPGAPAGASIDPATGEFSWTPDEADGPGSFPITVRVSDGITEVSEDFTIAVEEVNVPPVVDPLSDVLTFPGMTVTVQVVAADADLPVQTLGYSIVNGPPGAMIDTARVFRWSPDAGDVGSHTNVIEVSDGNGGAVQVSFVIQVAPVPIITDLIVDAPTGDLMVHWPSIDGVEYRLEYSPEIDVQTWTAVGTTTATGNTASLPHPLGANQRMFYRAVVLP